MKSLGMEYIYMEIYHFLGIEFNCVSTRYDQSLEEQFPTTDARNIIIRFTRWAELFRDVFHQCQINRLLRRRCGEKDGGGGEIR